MANITYSMTSIDEMGIRLKISGFSDKLFEFASTYIEIFLGCAENGFLQENLMHSIEKKRAVYENRNAEVCDKASHNRLLMLIPHTFHD